MGAGKQIFVAQDANWSKEGMALFGLDLPNGKGQVGGNDDEYRLSLHPEDRHLMTHFHELGASTGLF